MGLSAELIGEIIETLVEVVQLSGGSVVEPERSVFEVKDFEDNLILDLVKAVDAQVVVTSDRDLLELNPWNGRLVMTPRSFVEHVIRLKAIY